ncbi:MAG: Holliday junction branch migration protein RuvA [Oscillospiraceae bacterium]|nr:Holliday junction branch migration protein RuvA [Oscillospiraceae bacterium]
MIYSLRGVLIFSEDNYIVVECSGVGYKCLTSSETQRKVQSQFGNEVKIFTYMSVRENAVDLFGFSDIEELNSFKMLISVSGVGPKAGLAILSEFSTSQIAIFISSNDSSSITKVPGIGKKTAQRLILELRDKFKTLKSDNKNNDVGAASAAKNVLEASKALGVLGYSQNITLPVLSELDASLPVEQLIRAALHTISKL